MSDYGLASFEAQEAFAQSDWLRPPAAIRPEAITPENTTETEAVKERREARVQQRQAFVEIQMQALMDEVRALRKQVADYNRDQRIEDSHTAADLAQLKEQVDGLKQWVVRLVREKEGIETVCAWCKCHISGVMGADATHTSHGICPQCLEREFPEMAQEVVA